MAPEKSCLFCEIVAQRLKAAVIFSDERFLAFLDHRPVFRGHVLVVPKLHVATLPELDPDLVEPLFARVKAVSAALPVALKAQGTFVAVNNVVSQSVPHLHVHVVPRTKGDGLKGFFWPRTTYESAEQIEQYRAAIAAALSA